MDDAYERANSIEEQAMVRVREIYTAALRKALKEKKAFLQTVEAVRTGKKKPPAYYVNLGEEAVERWKQGFIRELIRQEKVIEDIIALLNAAGVEAADVIRGSMVDIYQTNREEAVQLIGGTAEQAGVSMSFAQYDKRQIAVILQENESPFSKIAYRNLGQNTAIRRRLQNELAQATILGEGQHEIIGRIRKVTDMTVSQARRVAQTERTRVQSQARWQAGEEAKAAGVGAYNTWSTRMVNSRDTHISLNGKKAMQGEPFVTSAGNSLKYPGDPSAPASEVINCHCVLVPDALLPGERLVDGEIVSADGLKNSENRGIMKLNLQLFAEADLAKQSTMSLRKGIASFQDRITEHESKISHPEKYYADWGNVSDKVRAGRIRHWEKEIKNFRESIQERHAVLRERGEEP